MTTSLVIGVDPGAKGAVAFLTPQGDLLAVEDVPVDTVKVGKHSRSRLSRHRLLALLSGAKDAAAFFEQPEYRPMRRLNPATGASEPATMGVSGAGAFGEVCGGIAMALVASGAALIEVRPGAWKAAVGLKAGKDDARRMAANLFPAQAALFARVKDDGRAEAALIGWYGARELRGGRVA